MRKLLLAVVASVFLLGQPAQAQQWLQFSTCGTPPRTLLPGQAATIGVDLNGSLCANATFTPSGTQNVNLTQILGAAPSLANPIWVTPATGAVFASSQSGNWTARIVGNAGAIVDGVIGAATAPANMLATGGVYNSTKPTLTTGQSAAMQLEANGSHAVSLYGFFSTPGDKALVATGAGVLITIPGDGTTNAQFVGTQADGIANATRSGYASAFNFGFNGSTWDRVRTITGAVSAGTGTLAVAQAPTSSSAAGITAVVSGSAEFAHVLKASAGNFYSVYATNLTATPGFLVVINSTSAGADGAITPLACAPLPSNGSTSINFGTVPSVYSTGITAIVTSSATCFTKTTGVITAYISGSVQ